MPSRETSSVGRPVDAETGTRSVDAAALKALSHPLRLRILTQLGSAGRANVKSLAAALEEPTNSVSYHLAQLAQHGLVVPAERPEGAARREKWWALAEAEGLSYRSESVGGPEERAALSGWFSQRAADNVGRALEVEDESLAQERPFGISDVGAWLSPEEAARVAGLLDEALDVLLDARDALGERAEASDGREYYQLMTMLFASNGDIRSSSRTGFFSPGRGDADDGARTGEPGAGSAPKADATA